MDDTELGTQKFQDFQEGQLQFLQDSRAYWFKILRNSRISQKFEWFPGIPVKIYKILGIFVDFQSCSLSISYRIPNVVHGVCVDIFWNSPIADSPHTNPLTW